MEAVAKTPVLLYTEQTPNPESLKFVTNRMLYRGTADFKEVGLAEEWSPLATELFKMPFVKGVYVCNNFVTISKEFNYDWAEIMLDIKNNIKKFVEDGGVILKDGFAEAMEKAQDVAAEHHTDNDPELVTRIKDLIDTYVKPAVEMDGGNIEFKKFDKGTVYVLLQGSCSGCPSSTVTLKSGIEGMLSRMIPEVKAVEAEMG